MLLVEVHSTGSGEEMSRAHQATQQKAFSCDVLNVAAGSRSRCCHLHVLPISQVVGDCFDLDEDPVVSDSWKKSLLQIGSVRLEPQC